MAFALPSILTVEISTFAVLVVTVAVFGLYLPVYLIVTVSPGAIPVAEKLPFSAPAVVPTFE